MEFWEFITDGKNINKENAFEMLEKMSHRGPDGLGSFFDKEIALLHRRLSILDVSDLENNQCIQKTKNGL